MTRWRGLGAGAEDRSAERAAALAAWAAEAEALDWAARPLQLHEPGPTPHDTWFRGGTLNVATNCLDRHLAERGDRVAVYWEGEPGDRRALTYHELHTEVVRFSGVLADLGVQRGDRVALYLGMVPETIVAMLACARLGAVHCVLFSALPAEALADRLADIEPKVLVTQDGSWRHGVVLPLKARADEALAATSGVQHTVVVRRTGIDIAWYEGDRWYHDLTAGDLTAGAASPDTPAQPHPADDPLLVLHLASRRGRPTGIVHRAAGLLVHATAFHRVLSTSVDDVFWCAVDIGWVAGQTHGIYGPLALGATTVAFEGTLDTPTHARTWQIIERYGVNSVMTTPSILRSLRRWVDSPPSVAKLDSLRLIVHGGEPLDDDTLNWLRDEVGRGRVLVRDGWGQTELGGIVAVDPPPDPPLPDPGLDVLGIDHPGAGKTGELVLNHPWPATFLRLQHRAVERYWHHPGCYATGDLARCEADGTITVLGRIDPVLSVSGQLVSAGEVRDVLEEHPYVAAAEVVARPDRRSGQAVAACVVLETSVTRRGGPPLQQLAADLRVHVRETIGGLAQPQVVAFCDELPADLPPAQLRQALTALCSSPRTGDVIHITRDRLTAAIEAHAPRAR